MILDPTYHLVGLSIDDPLLLSQLCFQVAHIILQFFQLLLQSVVGVLVFRSLLSLQHLLSVGFQVSLGRRESLTVPSQLLLHRDLVDLQIRVLLQRCLAESRSGFPQRVLEKMDLEFEAEVLLLNLVDDLSWRSVCSQGDASRSRTPYILLLSECHHVGSVGQHSPSIPPRQHGKRRRRGTAADDVGSRRAHRIRDGAVSIVQNRTLWYRSRGLESSTLAAESPRMVALGDTLQQGRKLASRRSGRVASVSERCAGAGAGRLDVEALAAVSDLVHEVVLVSGGELKGLFHGELNIWIEGGIADLRTGSVEAHGKDHFVVLMLVASGDGEVDVCAAERG